MFPLEIAIYLQMMEHPLTLVSSYYAALCCCFSCDGLVFYSLLDVQLQLQLLMVALCILEMILYRFFELVVEAILHWLKISMVGELI